MGGAPAAVRFADRCHFLRRSNSLERPANAAHEAKAFLRNGSNQPACGPGSRLSHTDIAGWGAAVPGGGGRRRSSALPGLLSRPNRRPGNDDRRSLG